MNVASESIRRADAGFEHINGHAAHSQLVYSRHNVGLAEMLQHSTGVLADHMRLWPLPSCGQQVGVENGPHSEFMTVFSRRSETNSI